MRVAVRRSILLLFVVSVVALAAPQRRAGNPDNLPADVAAGKDLFGQFCADCHGAGGSGSAGSDLTSGRFRRGGGDAELYNTISNGVPGTTMPGIFLEANEIWQLVEFVKGLSRVPAATPASGDPTQGEALLRGKGGCLGCHRLNDEGFPLGPDLSSIGATRSPGHLRRSLLRPNEGPTSQTWMVYAVTKSGKTVVGKRLNEDTLSIQLRDANDKLVSLFKRDLKEYRIEKAASMPSFEEVLSQQELDDLLAYLATLGR